MKSEVQKWLQREILLGFWKVHILHHAAQQAIYGQWMLTELRHHGYDVSPGTLYPILARMEEQGLIAGKGDVVDGSRDRREFRITRKGKETLRFLRKQIQELYDEVVSPNEKDSNK